MNDIKQRHVINKLDTPILWDELRKSITKLTNGKSPVLNSVPLDMFNALNVANIVTVHIFFMSYWEGTVDFAKFHEGQVVPVPKISDLGDPNKWRGVTLMDLGLNICSIILCTILFRTIKNMA